MLTRRFLATAVAAAAFVGASGGAHAAERVLVGIVLGRSYRQVLTKYGTPSRIQPVTIPVPGQGNGAYDPNNPGAMGGYGGAGGYGMPGGDAMGGGYPGGPGAMGGAMGMPGGMPGGPSYGAPGGMPGGMMGPAAGGSSGGPPVLPPVAGGSGGPGGMPGYGGPAGGKGGPGLMDNSESTQNPNAITGVSNGAEWIYKRPKGVTMSFVINEDGRVAQISVSGKTFAAARTARGVSLGNEYRRVLGTYGWPARQMVGPYYVEAYYTKNHHAAFTFVDGKLVRITIALAD